MKVIITRHLHFPLMMKQLMIDKYVPIYRYYGIILIDKGKCSWGAKMLLVRGDVISWVIQ
jgi:hypothetical protein